MSVDRITGVVLDCCIKIHSTIGPGCFEKVYEETLNYELCKRGLFVERQQTMPILYENLLIQDAYKMDLLIERKVVIEVKSVERLAPVHFRQLMTYLKLTGLKNGLLLNFDVELMKNGFNRVFNNEGN